MTNRATANKLIRFGMILIYLISTVSASTLVFFQVRELVSASEILPDITLGNEAIESPNIVYEEGQPLPIWTGTERLTVLVLGIDQRETEEGPWRTDTMMLLTLDPVTLQAGVLSIPRDLWVRIPGYTENRINTAHFIGDAYNHPGSGTALAIETVEYNLGISIDYYVRFNFNGFVNVINEIGGIEIYVEERVDDTKYPTPDLGTEHLIIEPGWHHFDGEMALKYARTRYSSRGDFDRARRQQQVMSAVLEQVTKPGNLPRLASRAPTLYATLSDAVQVGPALRMDQMIALAALAVKVDRSQIRFGVIDENCTLPRETPDHQQILVPLRDEIRAVRDYVFGVNGPETEEGTTITLSVLNGTGRAGLAGTTRDYLVAQGFYVGTHSNADRQDYENSLIILNRPHPTVALRLLELLGLPQSAVVNGDNRSAVYDIVIILGADYTGPPE